MHICVVGMARSPSSTEDLPAKLHHLEMLVWAKHFEFPFLSHFTTSHFHFVKIDLQAYFTSKFYQNPTIIRLAITQN